MGKCTTQVFLPVGAVSMGIKNVGGTLRSTKTRIPRKCNYFLSDVVSSVAIGNHTSPFWVIQYCWMWLCSLLGINKVIRLQVTGVFWQVMNISFSVSIQKQRESYFFLNCLYFFQKVESGGRCWGLHVPCMQLLACMLETFRLALSILVSAEW